MSTTLQQLNALTTIKNLLSQHFPDYDYYYSLESNLLYEIRKELGTNEEVMFDVERQTYIIKTLPECKVCHETAKWRLIEVPTLRGSFLICKDCKDEIANAPALVRG